jgi:hypothetical protein
MPRPPKINREILDIFRNLVKEENLLLACSDEDMVMMLNEELFVEHRISYRTFQRYKSRALRQMAIPDADPLYIDLFTILRTGYVRLRQQLLGAIIKDNIGAKRYMWILERKFKEWNIRWVAPEVELNENPEEPIADDVDCYPTLTGHYYDLNLDEQPKDISPAHHAIFQGYVLPNPNYQGDEDDTTRAIKAMCAFMDEYNMPEEEHRKLMAERGAATEKRYAEMRQKEAELAEEEAKQPSASPHLMRKNNKAQADKARAQRLAKIKTGGGQLYVEATEDNDYAVFGGEGLVAVR